MAPHNSFATTGPIRTHVECLLPAIDGFNAVAVPIARLPCSTVGVTLSADATPFAIVVILSGFSVWAGDVLVVRRRHGDGEKEISAGTLIGARRQVCGKMVKLS